MSKDICPHCGLEFHAGIRIAHIKACALRPTEAELHELYATHTSLKSLSDTIGVSKETVRKWLIAAGLPSYVPKTYKKENRPTTTIPGIAPLRHSHPSDCNACPGMVYCRDLITSIGWVLCEDPDDQQMDIWEKTGVNIYEITEILKLLAPHLFKTEPAAVAVGT